MRYSITDIEEDGEVISSIFLSPQLQELPQLPQLVSVPHKSATRCKL